MVSDDLKAHYDGYYEGQSEWRHLGAIDKSANIRRAWTHANPRHAPGRVLEIGCGDGSVLEQLGTVSGWDVQGVDISASGVSAAQSRGVVAEVFNGETLPFENRSFDLVVMTHVVEHLENPRHLLREAARVAKFVFVEVPLERHWRTKKNFAWTSLGHINPYDALLIRHLVQSCGMAVCVEFTTNPSRAVHRYQSGRKGELKWIVREMSLKIYPALARRLFSYHQSILASTEAI